MRLRSTASSNFSGSATKPGASAKVSHTMPISATMVTRITAAASAASASSAKRSASFSPSLSWVLVKSGTKAEAKPPSAKMRRKRLGRRWATKKASATGPAPRAAAMKMSRMKPRTRLVAVAPPTVAKFFRSDMGSAARCRARRGPARWSQASGRRAIRGPSARLGAPGRRRRPRAAGGSPPRAAPLAILWPRRSVT